MKPTKTAYCRVAQQLVAKMNDTHHAYAPVRGARLSYTKSPYQGAWVKVWVWVPQEMAILEQTKGKI